MPAKLLEQDIENYRNAIKKNKRELEDIGSRQPLIGRKQKDDLPFCKDFNQAINDVANANGYT